MNFSSLLPPVFAAWRVQAAIRQAQAFDRHSTQNVALNNFVEVSGGHSAIPDAFRIHDQVRSVLALVQASGFVGSHLSFEAALGQFSLEDSLELGLPGRIAAAPRMPRHTLVRAHKDVPLKIRHKSNLQDL